MQEEEKEVVAVEETAAPAEASAESALLVEIVAHVAIIKETVVVAAQNVKKSNTKNA